MGQAARTRTGPLVPTPAGCAGAGCALTRSCADATVPPRADGPRRGFCTADGSRSCPPSGRTAVLRATLTGAKERGMETPRGALPEADVVVPVFDAAARLPSLLDALAGQTVVPARIVLIDDGSSDRSAEVAESWGATHGKVDLRVLRQPNQGPAVARNLGVSE